MFNPLSIIHNTNIILDSLNMYNINFGDTNLIIL